MKKLVWKRIFGFKKGDTVKFRTEVDPKLITEKAKEYLEITDRKEISYGVIKGKAFTDKDTWLSKEVYRVKVYRPLRSKGAILQVAVEELSVWRPTKRLREEIGV